MSEDSVVRFQKPDEVQDPLTELLREGAQRLIRQAVEVELNELLACYAGIVISRGRTAVVRNACLPERENLTGIGPVPVKVPKGKGSAHWW